MSYQREESEMNESVLFSAFFALLWSQRGLKFVPDRDESLHVNFSLNMLERNNPSNPSNDAITRKIVKDARKMQEEFKSLCRY